MALTRKQRLRVLRRDRWTCRMPACLHPCTRAINPALDHTSSPWAPTVDHIVQRAYGGTDGGANLRAAHQLCNARAALLIPGQRRPIRRGPWGGIIQDPADVLGGSCVTPPRS